MKFVWVWVSALIALGTWLLPKAKPFAVAGRLNYSQFLLLVISASLFLSSLAIALSRERRRQVAFRVAAVWLGIAAVWLPWEAVSVFLPTKHIMDNPWYVANRVGIQAADDLPFERPAHLEWEGISRGDLVIFGGGQDPCARMVRFETDFQGFRNGTDLRQADVVFIGDSFTEAGNIAEQESFVHVLGSSLDLVVRNLGRAFYSAPTELTVLEKYGLDCKPRAVVWQIAESNDLQDAVQHRNWKQAGKPPFFEFCVQTPSPHLALWQCRSPSLFLFMCLRRTEAWPWEGSFQTAQGKVYPVRFLEPLGPKHRAADHPGWPLIARAIRQGQRSLNDHKITLVVLLIPTKFRALMDATEMSPITKARLLSDLDFDPELTLGFHLESLCKDLGVSFVDCTPSLRRSAAAGELVYLPMDTHLSPKGHKVVGELLVDALKELKD